MVRDIVRRAALASLLIALCSLPVAAQTQTKTELTLATDAVEPARFVAAHGERALLMGYPGPGLEAWAYPFQLFRAYHVEFLPQGTVGGIEGTAILRRIECRPEEVVRIYVGLDFEVREHLFVPLDRPGVILRYDVEGRRSVDVKVAFLPVLNLMWPAGLGGQDLRWSEALRGYVISEVSTGFRAEIASPQAVAHSELVNSTMRQNLTQSMVLHPASGEAEVYAALESRSETEGSQIQALEQEEPQLRAAAAQHVNQVLQQGIQIETPDAKINEALAWSRIALDQAWVCNPRIGCGFVAGYGPSRGTRRPQYAWYFAGDGLTGMEAQLAEGDAEGARAELAFIFKYQNRANGMIWHEISQSAGFIDWAGKYPYMYVHVDITFAFLSALADYYTATGDVDFLREHWKQIEAAYAYCRESISAQTGLPEIPAGKEGGNEQDRMSEDVGLSASWISASAAYAQLAAATGHSDDASAAAAASGAARKAFAIRYWDKQKQFWIAGYSASGKEMTDERSHPELLGRGLFTPGEEDAALDQLATSNFQTDWGARGLSAVSPRYDPNLYASGSVFALHTADMAEGFWRDHRPAIAAAVWESLLPWLQLDSLGHMDEVLAGDLYHPEEESVPEQMWSPAGFLHAAIHGLFGVEVNAPEKRLTLTPHLDPRWGEVSLAQMGVGGAQVAAKIEQKPGETDVELAAHGGSVHVSFAPEIPLGATGVHATVDGRRSPVGIEEHAEDEHARVEMDVAEGTVRCRIFYAGGVRVLAPVGKPEIGDPSRQLKLTGVHLEDRTLTLEADVESEREASVELLSAWKPGGVQGGAIVAIGNNWYRVTFTGAPAEPGQPYTHRRMTVAFRTR